MLMILIVMFDYKEEDATEIFAVLTFKIVITVR